MQLNVSSIFECADNCKILDGCTHYNFKYNYNQNSRLCSLRLGNDVSKRDAIKYALSDRDYGCGLINPTNTFGKINININ